MKKQALLRPPFLFLWLAQICSQLAFNMVNFILILFVFEETSSNTVVSALVISFTLPSLLLGMLAGIYVDHRNKKGILLLTNISRGILTTLFYFVRQNIPLVFLLGFLVSGATQFFIPAEAASIPRMVKKPLLISANSLFTLTLYGSILMGFVLAGPLLKVFGFANTFLFAALLYFLAALFVSLLPSLGAERGASVRDFLRNDSIKRVAVKMKEIYRLMRGVKKILLTIVFLTVSQGLIMVLATLLPGYSKTVLGIEVTDIFLVILTPAMLGMILGSLLLVNFGKKLPQRPLVNASIILSGLILLFLPSLSRFNLPKIFELDVVILVAILLFILGVANAFVVVVANTTLQRDIKKQMIGGIYGVVVALSAAFALFPVILAGGLADIFGVGLVLAIIGLIIVVSGIFKIYKEYGF